MHTVVVYAAVLRDGAYWAKGRALERIQHHLRSKALATFDYYNARTHAGRDGSRRRSFCATVIEA